MQPLYIDSKGAITDLHKPAAISISGAMKLGNAQKPMEMITMMEKITMMRKNKGIQG